MEISTHKCYSKNKINAVDMLINRSKDVMAIASKLLINICLRSYALQAEGLSILHVCIFSAFRITKNILEMENVKNAVAQLAEKPAVAGNAASNNMAPDDAWAPDSHNNNNITNDQVPPDSGDMAGGAVGGGVAGSAASNNKLPDNTAMASDSHNNNNNVTSDKDSGEMPAAGRSGGEMAGNAASNNRSPDNAATVPAGAAALPDEDVEMEEVGLALANSLARAMEDVPSDARAWTPIKFPDGVLGMVALHPDTTVGAINGRLANMFGARCWFLGFQMVAGYNIAAPARYTMRDLGELRTDLAIGSFMEDYFEE